MARRPSKPPDDYASEGAGSNGPANIAHTVITGGSGGDEQDRARTGATLSSRYYPLEQDVVGVAVDDLRDFRSASIEEFWQFAVGNFFAAGSFWLGLERLATASIWWKDTTFWVCVVAFLAGLVIGFFGYRQLNRRQTRIDVIIRAAIAAGAKRHTTDSTGI